MNKIKYFVYNLRLKDWWWWIAVFHMGVVIASPIFDISKIYAFIGFFLLIASVYSLNNSLDFELDRLDKTKSNPVAKGFISFKDSIIETIILSIVGLLFLLMVSKISFFSGILLTVFNINYHVKPFRFKNRPYLDVLNIIFIFSMPFAIGFFSFKSISLPPILLSLFFGSFSGTAHLLQTAKDYNYDNAFKLNTISTRIGIKKTLYIAVLFVFLNVSFFILLISIGVIPKSLAPITLVVVLYLIKHNKTIKNINEKSIMSLWNYLRIVYISGAALSALVFLVIKYV